MILVHIFFKDGESVVANFSGLDIGDGFVLLVSFDVDEPRLLIWVFLCLIELSLLVQRIPLRFEFSLLLLLGLLLRFFFGFLLGRGLIFSLAFLVGFGWRWLLP